jgi:plastocyanin
MPPTIPPTMPSVRVYLLSALLLGILLGCDDRHQTSSAPATAPAPGSAKIIGRILLADPPPAMPLIDVSAVADCAKLHPQGIPDESIVIGKSGSLQNAIVYLKGVGATAAGSSRSPVVLDQVACQYRPHVLAVQTGQIVRVQSQDPFMHNVNVRAMQNDPTNFAQQASPGTTPSRDLTFAAPEFFSVQCDVHPWMRAWIGVFDHPYFAVSDATGSFEIDNVPAGTFTLAVWQERLGELTQQITVADGKNRSVTFTYSR